MDLATGQMIRRPRVETCKMMRMVIDRVEELARRQGFKTLKYFNRKREEMILTPADLLAGVGRGPQPAKTNF